MPKHNSPNPSKAIATLQLAKGQARKLAARGNDLGNKVVVGKLFEPSPGGELWTWRILLMPKATTLVLEDGRRFVPDTVYASKALGQLYESNPVSAPIMLYKEIVAAGKTHGRSVQLGVLLAFLRALAEIETAFHWSTSGRTYYADHLLFQRIYDETYKEIDPLAERVVALEGEASVEPLLQADLTHRAVASFLDDYVSPIGHEAMPSVLLNAESAFLHLIQLVRTQLGKKLSTGLDNLLSGLADVHESHVYLLQQRTERS